MKHSNTYIIQSWCKYRFGLTINISVVKGGNLDAPYKTQKFSFAKMRENKISVLDIFFALVI